MNEINLNFKEFIYKLLNATYKDRISEEVMGSLNDELKDLIDQSNDVMACKVKTFFTFDQQLDHERYRPHHQDFNKNYEFVFSGCSQTHGDHVTPPLVSFGDHKYIWGFQIANKYNKDALNLGMGGWSAESILKGLMSHFQKNGNPKVLLVLYPDFGRLTFVDNHKMKPKNVLNHHELIQHYFLQPWDEQRYQKISKSPHLPNDILPWTQALYRSLQSILTLDQYCKDNNIYFKYFSWDYNSNVLLKLLKNNFSEYSNYCEPEFLNILKMKETLKENNITCHDNEREVYPQKIWDLGIDNNHIGIHHHIHIAEQFMKEIDNDNPWN